MADVENTGSASFVQCRAAGCTRRANRVGAGLCEKHYSRQRRIGSLDLPPKAPLVHSNGYLMDYASGHPLATPGGGGRVYQHRVRYYEKHGDGPFVCHWCGSALTWATMDVDHLNGVKTDNEVENLVASCPRCNRARAAPLARARTKQTKTIHYLEHEGTKRSVAEWASVVGISRNSLLQRIKAGWSVPRALTEPRGKTGPKADLQSRHQAPGV